MFLFWSLRGPLPASLEPEISRGNFVTSNARGLPLAWLVSQEPPLSADGAEVSGSYPRWRRQEVTGCLARGWVANLARVELASKGKVG